jgi:hypothetical protein
VTVDPIVSPTLSRLQRTECQESKLLVVNFSGCSNPLIEDTYYEDYVRIQTADILDAARSNYDRVVFGARKGTHATIRRCALELGVDIEVDHYPQSEFLIFLSQADRAVTSPGLTTTLECMALSTPIGFLLPQNYSQALMAEQNVSSFGASRCLALSTFGATNAVPPGLPEEEGVRRVAVALATIFRDHRSEVKESIRKLITEPWNSATIQRPVEPRGQDEVAKLLLDLCTAGRRSQRDDE